MMLHHVDPLSCAQVRSAAVDGQSTIVAKCAEATDRFKDLAVACDSSIQEASRFGGYKPS